MVINDGEVQPVPPVAGKLQAGEAGRTSAIPATGLQLDTLNQASDAVLEVGGGNSGSRRSPAATLSADPAGTFNQRAGEQRPPITVTVGQTASRW
jgi:hypothetical protein